MSQRYAFFRSPNGKAYRGHDGKHAPKNILSLIGVNSSLNSEGRAQWVGWNVFNAMQSVQSAFVIIYPDDDEMNDYDAHNIVSRSIRVCF